MALRWSPENLRDTRHQRGMSKSALARRLETQWATVHAYERGKATPTVARLCALADVLGVTVSNFFTDDEAA